jgi:cytochrome c oxidase subunit 2
MPGRIQSALTRHRRLLALAILAGGVVAVLVWGVLSPSPADPFKADYTDAELARRIERGAAVFAEQNCAECHATAPSAEPSAVLKGPTLVGLVGGRATLEDGRVVPRDHRYLRRAIVDSRAEVVEGYGFQVMPDYSHLSEEDLVAVLLYLRSLGAETSE